MGNCIASRASFAELYQELYGQMVVYATSVLRDPVLAEEAVQDTFCICYKATDTPSWWENPKGWLMQTLQTVIRNMQHYRGSMNRLLMQSLQSDHLNELLVYDGTNETSCGTNQAAHTDFQMLKHLVLDGCTMLEVAKEHGMRVELCRRRIQRISVHLQRKLTEY